MRSLSGIVAVTFAIAAAGCARPTTVAGKVTCNGKPVRGSILFSPAGEGGNNTGEAVAVPLKDDGSYSLAINTVGKHRVVVSPEDVVYTDKPGGAYPCDLSPLEKVLAPGSNEIIIELPPQKK